MLKKELLEKVTKVVIIDGTEEYQRYQEFKRNNEGHEDFEDYLTAKGLECVRYIKEFHKDKDTDNAWELHYGCTGKQYICPVCGKHENHYISETDGYSCGHYGAGCHYLADSYDLLEAVSTIFGSETIDVFLYVGDQKYDMYGDKLM